MKDHITKSHEGFSLSKDGYIVFTQLSKATIKSELNETEVKNEEPQLIPVLERMPIDPTRGNDIFLIKSEINEGEDNPEIQVKSEENFSQGEEKRFDCTKCIKTFTSKLALINHVSSIHEKKKSHTCSICGKILSKPFRLEEHMR